MENSELLQFKKDGYYLYRNFLDINEIQIILDEAKAIFINQLYYKNIIDCKEISNEEFEKAIVKLFTNFFQLYANCGKQVQHLISLHRLSLNNKIYQKLNLLGQDFPVISTRPVLYFNKAKLAKTEEFYKVPPHQDWRSMQGSINSLVVWVPLIDINEELGALRVVPKSHKSGLLESQENNWFREINNLNEKDFISIEVKKGDALFFSSFLVHSSGNNLLDKIRWSCHFRYNDLAEESFIERGYVHPYIYKPIQELITPSFPTIDQIKKSFL